MAAGSSTSASASGSGESPFVTWVKENGGDESFVAILHSFGFTSKLSLSK